MPVLPLDCHLPTQYKRYNNEQTTKQTEAINNSYIYISHVNVTQTVPDISPLMPMHQYPLLVHICDGIIQITLLHWFFLIFFRFNQMQVMYIYLIDIWQMKQSGADLEQNECYV